jgi:hypothetical protein
MGCLEVIVKRIGGCVAAIARIGGITTSAKRMGDRITVKATRFGGSTVTATRKGGISVSVGLVCSTNIDDSIRIIAVGDGDILMTLDHGFLGFKQRTI